MGVNKHLQHEAMEIFEQENLLVSITYETYETRWSYRGGVGDQSVAVIATGDQARSFPGIAMSIDFDAGYQPAIGNSGQREKRHTAVLAIEDLPAACATLQQKLTNYNTGSIAVAIRVTISNQVGKTSMISKDGVPVPGSKLSKCLNPLRQLRGAHLVEISGPTSASYKADTIAIMSGRRLSANEAMQLIGAHLDQGDKVFLANQLELAIKDYQAALYALHRSHLDVEHETSEKVIGGRYHGLEAGW